MLEALAHSGLGKVQDTAKLSLPLVSSASTWSCSQQEKEQFRFVNCIGLVHIPESVQLTPFLCCGRSAIPLMYKIVNLCPLTQTSWLVFDY